MTWNLLCKVQEGIGLAFVAKNETADELAVETFVQVLRDWCRPYPGSCLLDDPNRTEQTGAPLALVSVLRTRSEPDSSL
jgi:hypothetical protein